jgi:regulator of nucleoside diphosphate kinase
MNLNSNNQKRSANMTAQKTISEKAIVITAADFDRLHGLVASPRFRMTHAVLLHTLKEELDRGKVVSINRVPRNVVTMRSRVRIHDLGNNERETYTLVYPDEADITANKLSVLAPLGTALLGTRVGQVVTFDAPAGQRQLKVEKILYQPEAAGDLHL